MNPENGVPISTPLGRKGLGPISVIVPLNSQTIGTACDAAPKVSDDTNAAKSQQSLIFLPGIATSGLAELA
jgi:hypothetical protein